MYLNTRDLEFNEIPLNSTEIYVDSGITEIGYI